jgi:hypothetical protein
MLDLNGKHMIVHFQKDINWQALQSRSTPSRAPQPGRHEPDPDTEQPSPLRRKEDPSKDDPSKKKKKRSEYEITY